MIRVRLETAQMRRHTDGVRRARAVRWSISLLCVFGLVMQVGHLAVKSAQSSLRNQRATTDQAIGAIRDELERLQITRESRESAERQRFRFERSRQGVLHVLKEISSAVPTELSLTELWFDDQALRLRGIAAHGGAIRMFLDALSVSLPVREAVLENVQRIQERGNWHDQFLVRVVLLEGLQVTATVENISVPPPVNARRGEVR